MRLFVAWSAPEDLASRIAQGVDRARDAVPAASWTRSHQFHLTFAFLGEQPEAITRELGEALRAEVGAIARFDLRFSGVGAFPNDRRARVIWIGVEEDPRLAELAGAVRHSLDGLGIEYDRKPFRGHLTIARTRDRWRSEDVDRVSSALEPVRGRTFCVDSLSLYVSRLGRGGAQHEVLERIPLSGQAGSPLTS